MSYPNGEFNQLLAEIHRAILNDDALRLAHLCQEDVDLDEHFTPEINEQHVGMTPLSLACALNKPQLAEVLLNSGADVNSTFATLQTTALMTSSFHGHVDVVRLLLSRGADVRMLDTQMSTALGYAFGGTRNSEVINMLLKSGIDVNQKNMLGMNALLLVAGYGNDTLVHMVLAAGADANATNDFGHTALHLAVVGKKDQLKKFRTGAPESSNLNRRNLDMALKEWARLHKDQVGNQNNEEAYTKVGNCMMSIGQKLEAGDGPDEDEQEVMKRRVEAVWRYRQDRMHDWKAKKKGGGIGSLLCGGGKSKKVSKNNAPTNKPYVPSDAEIQNNPQANEEIQQINERCARVLSMLIKAGCEVDRTESAFGMTALDMAVLNGDVESSAQLVSAGGDPDHLMKMFALSDVYAAIATRNKKDLKDQVTYDEDLDLNMPFSRFSVTHKSESGVELPSTDDTGDEGLTPIAVAVRTDDVDIVRMLLRHGATIDGTGPAGRAAIHEAAGKGLTKMCAFLMTNGANPEITASGFLNCTPLTIAAIMHHLRTVELFITRGAKVDKDLSDNSNALLKAGEQQDMEMLHTLLSADLQTNFENTNGFTYAMASKYQSRERDAQAILQEVQGRLQQLQREEQEKERQRQLAEENRHRILPRPEPVPQQQPPAQPGRPAPVMANNTHRQPMQPQDEGGYSPQQHGAPPVNYQQGPPPQQQQRQAPPGHHQQAPPPGQQPEEESEEETDSEEEESEEDEEEQPVPQQMAPPVAARSSVPAAETQIDAPAMIQPVQATNIDDEDDDEEETSSEEEESSEEESEDEVPPPQQAPPTGVPPMSPDVGPPPPLPSGPPPPIPAGPPPESDEEEESEEETDSEEEESSEEEETPAVAHKQVVQRSQTTAVNAQGQTITHTKTTIVTTNQQQPARAAEEETDSEEEETDSEEEETDSEEGSEEEESEEEQVNNNLVKPMNQLNMSHDNKETTI